MFREAACDWMPAPQRDVLERLYLNSKAALKELVRTLISMDQGDRHPADDPRGREFTDCRTILKESLKVLYTLTHFETIQVGIETSELSSNVSPLDPSLWKEATNKSTDVGLFDEMKTWLKKKQESTPLGKDMNRLPRPLPWDQSALHLSTPQIRITLTPFNNPRNPDNRHIRQTRGEKPADVIWHPDYPDGRFIIDQTFANAQSYAQLVGHRVDANIRNNVLKDQLGKPLLITDLDDKNPGLETI